MDINALNANLNRDKWGVRNFRALKSLLVKEVQESLSEFMPLTSSSYYNNPIQVLDFFSGAGGTSLGFAALNTVIPTFKMLGGCDINQISAQTYSRNFDTPVIHEDIVRLANEEGALETLLESIGFDTNKPTILIGCAPCQGFSSHRKRHWDEEDDVRNSLVMAFATIVGKIMPDVIVMENVPEFLSQKYWRYFSAAKKSYQQLGYTVKEHKLIITDGIDFVFCFTETPVVVSIIDKARMDALDWSRLPVDPLFRFYMEQFFSNPAPQRVDEEKLVELVAIRTRNLADEIRGYSDLTIEEAMNEDEHHIIELLNGLRELVYNHNDPQLRTGRVFADFTAQVIMFCLLFAHRVICSSEDTPTQKAEKIRSYAYNDVADGEALLPFRNLMVYLRDHAGDGMFIGQWVDECIAFLSYA